MNHQFHYTHSLRCAPVLTLVCLMLSACTGMERTVTQPVLAPLPSSTTVPSARFEPWATQGNSLSIKDIPVATITLARQADGLIAQKSYTQAADKLERALRIAPDYAAGWSRLAWLSLQAADLDKSRQLADRSNSYAAGQVPLKLLNWSFIKDASAQLNDVAAVKRAERNIEALGNL